MENNEFTEELTGDEEEQIAREIELGNTSGIIDSEEGVRVSWNLVINKFKN